MPSPYYREEPSLLCPLSIILNQGIARLETSRVVTFQKIIKSTIAVEGVIVCECIRDTLSILNPRPIRLREIQKHQIHLPAYLILQSFPINLGIRWLVVRNLCVFDNLSFLSNHSAGAILTATRVIDCLPNPNPRDSDDNPHRNDQSISKTQI